MRRRTIWISALSVLVILFSQSMTWAETSFRYMTILYGGDLSDSDAVDFKTNMESLGWYTRLWRTSHNRSILPVAANYLDGDANNFGINDTDLAYISGHGYNTGHLQVRHKQVDGSFTTQFWITPESGITGRPSGYNNEPIYEVGAQWLSGSTTTTESKWRTQPEWIIIAGCGQLNYSSSDPAVWGNLKLAQVWGRTMLGTNRVHAILGYHHGAPPDVTDNQVVSNFMSFTQDGFTVLNSWLWANSSLSVAVNYAAIWHNANASDYLHGIGSGATPDTTGTPDLQYVSNTSSTVSLPVSLSGLKLATAGDFGSLGYLRNITSPGRLSVLPAKPISNKQLISLLGGSITESPTMRKDYSMHRGQNGYVLYQSSLTGGIELMASKTEIRPTSQTLDEAQKTGEAFLAQAGLLPQDAVLRRAGQVFLHDLPVGDEGGTTEGKAALFAFEYGRIAPSGVEVDGYGGEGITVVVGEQGVVYLKHLWRQMTEVAAPADVGYLSKDAAISQVHTKLEQRGTEAAIEIQDSTLVYFSPSGSQHATELTPAWRVTVDGFPYFVDAVTGEVLTGE